MTCTLCRGVERWLSRIDPIFAEEGTKFWAEVRKGGNTDSLFFADPDPQRLRELVALAKTAPERAFADFLALAERGSVWSMITVASIYATGKGAPRNLIEAERWCLRARNAGSDEGLLRSARYAYDRGDLPTARAILMAGAERGLTRALRVLAQMELKAGNRSEALARFEQAAARGNFAAQADLAKDMSRGAFGWTRIPQGLRRAILAIRFALSEIEARAARRRSSLEDAEA